MNDSGKTPKVCELTRRHLLQKGLATGAALSFDSVQGDDGATTKKDLILRENKKPGTLDWMLNKTSTRKPRGFRASEVEGFCSATSLRCGETLKFYVNTESESSVTIDLYRMGYYQGLGGRHVDSLGPYAITPQRNHTAARSWDRRGA